jgi:hypothetical protein
MDFPKPINTAPYKIIDPTNLPSNQCSLTNTVSQMGNFGFFLLLLLIGYLCLKRWSRRQGKQSIGSHQQQIERLEKIWKMTDRRKF